MRKTQDSTEYRNRLRKAVQKTGEWIQEHADEIVPEIDYIVDLSLFVNFSPEECPTIEVEVKHVMQEAHRALFCVEEEDGNEGNLEKKNKGGL